MNANQTTADCPRCGESNEAENRFCNECGAPLRAANAPAPLPDAPPLTSLPPLQDGNAAHTGAPAQPSPSSPLERQTVGEKIMGALMNPRYWNYLTGVLLFGVVFVVVGGLCALIFFVVLPSMGYLGDWDTMNTWPRSKWVGLWPLAMLLGLVSAFFCCRGFFLSTPESEREERIHTMQDQLVMHSPHGHIIAGWVEVAPGLYAEVRTEHLKWKDKVFGRQDKDVYEEVVQERVAALLPPAYFFGDGIFSIGCDANTICVAEVTGTRTHSAVIVGIVPIPTGESARETKIIEWRFPASTPCQAAISTSTRHHKSPALILTFGGGGKQVVFPLPAPATDAVGETSLEEVLAFLARRMPSFQVQRAI